MYGSLRVFDDIGALNEALAQHWQTVAESAIARRGAFHVALAGGSTPQRFYQRLAQADCRDRLPWQQTHIYFGDERCVAQDHADSNFRMASEALLSRVPIPEAQIHAMYNPSFSAGENAERYARLLKKNLPAVIPAVIPAVNGAPVFDLILLGMGDDGHTASLFPDTAILQESQKAVAAQFVDKLNAWRISLTYSVINAADHVVILVAGETKSAILRKVLGEDSTVSGYPVQGVNPSGQFDWYLDRAAARQLSERLP